MNLREVGYLLQDVSLAKSLLRGCSGLIKQIPAILAEEDERVPRCQAVITTTQDYTM